MDRNEIIFGESGAAPPKLERVVFFDPGLGGTGWAFFPKITRGGNVVAPSDSGVLRAPKSERWQNQCHSLGASVLGMLKGMGAAGVVLEMPELWAGSAISNASATHKAKPGEPADLFKLVYLVGVLGAAALGAVGALPVLVSPAEWKGRLAKDMVTRRIQAALPGSAFRDHEWDAVGMGLAAQGVL